MISTALTAGAINAALATALAAAVLAATWAWRNPFVARGLWLAVLLRFLAPPFVLLPVIQVAQTPTRDSEIAMPPSVSSPEALPRAAAGPAPSPAATIAASPASDDPAPLPAFVRPPRALVPTSFAIERRATVTPQWCAAFLWIAGSMALTGIGLWRIARFHAAVRRAALAPPTLQRRAAEIAAGLTLRRPPQIRLTTGRTPPLVWPLGRSATVLLPAALINSLDDDQQSAILAHELTHLRRRDAWTRWLELAVIAAFWWCPTAWLARRRLQDAEERCCDADALAAFPRWRRAYADALLATIEFLSPSAPSGLLATPLARRGALLGRFQMLTSTRSPVRPSRAIRWLLASVALALLLTSPTAVAESEVDPDAATVARSVLDNVETMNPSDASTPEVDQSPDQSETSAPDDADCTIELADGTRIQGAIIARDGDRIVILSRAQDAIRETEGVVGSAPLTLSDAEHVRLWDLELSECFLLAAVNNQAMKQGRVAVTRVGSTLVLGRSATDIEINDFQSLVHSNVRDIADTYWELWFAGRDLDAMKAGRDHALKLWRRVKSLERAGQIAANSEAQARSEYYRCRALVESSLTSYFRVENRLRYLLGLSSSDGRLIRPIDEPTSALVQLNWDAVHDEALANRIELQRQKGVIKKRELELLTAKKQTASQTSAADRYRWFGAEGDAVDSAKTTAPHSGAESDAQEAPADGDAQEWELGLQFTMPSHDRLALTAIRHHQMLLDREKQILRDMELEVRHQLADAVRDVELNFQTAQTNRNRLAAGEEEMEAVNTLFSIGRTTLDRVIDAQSRAAEAAAAASRSRADYARAVMRLHFRKGTLLDYYNIELADPAANN